jgi:hypothetical protein
MRVSFISLSVRSRPLGCLPPMDASYDDLCYPSVRCPGSHAWMPFRAASGTFGPALRPGFSTSVLQHVMVRGIERTTLFRGDLDRTAPVLQC